MTVENYHVIFPYSKLSPSIFLFVVFVFFRFACDVFLKFAWCSEGSGALDGDGLVWLLLLTEDVL